MSADSPALLRAPGKKLRTAADEPRSHPKRVPGSSARILKERGRPAHSSEINSPGKATGGHFNDLATRFSSLAKIVNPGRKTLALAGAFIGAGGGLPTCRRGGSCWKTVLAAPTEIQFRTVLPTPP